MSDYWIKKVTDEYGFKMVIIFYTGKISKPELILTDFEFQQLIKKYNEQTY